MSAADLNSEKGQAVYFLKYAISSELQIPVLGRQKLTPMWL